VPADAREEQLARSVLRIACGGTLGTGFVVDGGRLLTCRHVIAPALERGAAIEVTDRDGRSYDGATVRVAKGPGWPDLALLDLPAAAGRPALVLDAAPTPRGAAQDLVVGGFPAQAVQVPYQTRGFASGGEQNHGPPGDGAYLRLDGDPVVGGMSGGPVLNLTSGFVCGIVRLTLADQTDAGGFAVPLATVLQQLPELRAVHDRPGPAARPWIELLGPVHLKSHRRDADGTRWDVEAAPAPRVDLRVVTGTPPGGWTVSVAEPAHESVVGAGDLGGEVMEALDRWSRRRPLESRAEAELLGTLLWKALLPGPVSRLLPAAGPGARTLVRIRLDRTDRLAAVPWEYARAGGKAVAADEALAFSRYVDVDSAPVLRKDRVRVLGVTVCPPAVAARLPTRFSRSGGKRLSDGATLAAGLARSMTGEAGSRPQLEVTVVDDVTLDDLDRLLRDEGPWDVVHYVGLGWELDDGEESTLAFSDGLSDVVPVPLATVLDLLVEHRCPLVVVQLLSSPLDRPGPALGAMRLLPLLDRGVQALVVAQHAATDGHLSAFDKKFYERLAAGDSVEVATQEGRRTLLQQPPDLDYTAFGAVTVTTTRDGDLRLLAPGLGVGSGAGRPLGRQPAPVDPRPPEGIAAPRDELGGQR
jgi:hypothetical protein